MADGQPGALVAMRTLVHAGALGGISDAQLLEHFLGQPGHAAELAFETLLRRHGPMVLRLCRRVLDDPHGAQDAFQATFLVLARKARSISDPEQLGNWLHGVAYRTAMKARTGASRRRRHERKAAARASEAVSEDRAGRDLTPLLREEVDRLPERYRAPVVFCHLQGMSYASAAQLLGVTEGALRGRLVRGRSLLRDRLERRGVSAGLWLLAPGPAAEKITTIEAGLLRSTVEACTRLARAGTFAAGPVSIQGISLTKEVLKTMLVSRSTIMLGCLLGFSTLALGARVAFQNSSPAADRPAPRVASAGRISVQDSLALVGQASPRQARARDRTDEALAKLVGARIVGTSPISKDCMVLSYLPDWSHGQVDNLGVANNDGGVRTLVDWGPLPPPDSATSQRRYLLALFSRQTNAAGKVGSILAFEISEDWPERTSWKTQPEYAVEPAARYEFVSGEGWKLFDITPLVHDQAEAGRKRHGVMLRFLSEDRSGQKKNWSGYQFVSREASGEWEGRRPQLLIVEKPGK
jgi:RNA polymerase sigma factor (sigma-70 family)